MLPATWAFDMLWNGVRSLNTVTMRSISQRATKLLAGKLWEWFDPPIALAHTSAEMAKAADFFLRTPNLTASNFAALWPTDLRFLALKDLNLFSKCVKFQDAGRILRVGLAWSKWPHFHRVYLVAVCKRSSMAVLLHLNLMFHTFIELVSINVEDWKRIVCWK